MDKVKEIIVEKSKLEKSHHEGYQEGYKEGHKKGYSDGSENEREKWEEKPKWLREDGYKFSLAVINRAERVFSDAGCSSVPKKLRKDHIAIHQSLINHRTNLIKYIHSELGKEGLNKDQENEGEF